MINSNLQDVSHSTPMAIHENEKENKIIDIEPQRALTMYQFKPTLLSSEIWNIIVTQYLKIL